MKKTVLILLGIIYLSVMSHTVIAQTKITHIAVYVKDLKKSADFYSKVFDFPELNEPFKDGLHAWFDIGNNLSLHVIQAPWEPITINKNNHICFSVPDIDEFIANLGELGIAFEDWPGNKGKVNTRPDGIKQIYIRDPDGYWIEINDEY
jgi:lactoylglutathione lyase